jgi:uncharacterized OsmC-like protein
MQTSKIIYKGDLRTEAVHVKSGQVIVTDAPTDNEGKGEAFSPTDLLATSLACCMITVMGIYARKNKLALQIEADLQKHMQSQPRKVSAIDIKLSISGVLTKEQKNSLEAIALNCPVAKSLDSSIIQNVQFTYN